MQIAFVGQDNYLSFPRKHSVRFNKAIIGQKMMISPSQNKIAQSDWYYGAKIFNSLAMQQN